MTDNPLHEEWRQRLEEFSQSQMSAADWCFDQEIPLHQFYYWRRKFADTTNASKKAAAEAAPDGWMALALKSPQPAAPALPVRIGGAVIEVAPGFDPSLLRAVVAALAQSAQSSC